ncbi:MAG: hypothetical protein ACTSXJ_03325 [Candidatus Baldrarchaeia archaeon]
MEKRVVTPDMLEFRLSKVREWIKFEISAGGQDLYVGYINPIVFKDEKELRSISRDIAKLLIEGKGLQLNVVVDASLEDLEDIILEKLKEGR